jgi:hypothetical protein
VAGKKRIALPRNCALREPNFSGGVEHVGTAFKEDGVRRVPTSPDVFDVSTALIRLNKSELGAEGHRLQQAHARPTTPILDGEP